MKKRTGAVIVQYILAFGIPFLVIVLAYIGLRISPFGNKTIIISDAIGYYLPDLSYLGRALRGQEDLLYSFELGIGMNSMAVHGGLYNLAYILVLFFDIGSYPAMFSWLMAIDIAFCGLTMYIFLSSVYGRKTENLIFSTVYALIGFNVAYCFQIYFLLGVELLPLIALGIKKIISGKSPWLYLIALGYAVFSGFYYGYMLCIASVALFLMWYAEDRKSLAAAQKKRIWINYAGASVAAGLLPAAVWIPALVSLSGGRLDYISIFNFTMDENLPLADLFAKLFIGANNTDELVDGGPNIFCGTLVPFLAAAFFIDRRNTKRMKLIRAFPLIFYFLTFYIKALSMIVQSFSATGWFNYRYSYVFSFLLILVAFEEFAKFRTMDVRDFKRTCMVFAAFVAVIFTRRYSFVSGGWALLGILILCGCLGAIWWNRVDEKKAPRRALAVLLVLLCSMEGYVNYMVCTNKLFDWSVGEKEYQVELLLGRTLTDSVAAADAGFYRMGNENSMLEEGNNDPCLFGYNGVNYFGSCERNFVLQGMRKLGMAWWVNRMWYVEGVPDAFDSLLGLKYVIARRDLSEEKGYERTGALFENAVYKNGNALPIGMVSDERISTVTLGKNPFENHNNLWKALAGSDQDVFTREDDISFTYHAGYDGETINYQEALRYSEAVSGHEEEDHGAEEGAPAIGSTETAPLQERIVDEGSYIECNFAARQDGSVYAYIGSAASDVGGYILEPMKYLGEFKKGDVITDYIPVDVNMTKSTLKSACAGYYVGYANDEVLTELSKQLQDGAGELVKLTDSHLKGSVTVERDGRLFFTIPYDEGWTLTVDGIETPLEMTADLFMSAKVSGGSHTYEMKFFPKGMGVGIAVSCGAVLLVLLMIIYNAAARKRRIAVSAGGNEGQEAVVGDLQTEMTTGAIDAASEAPKGEQNNMDEGNADDLV